MRFRSGSAGTRCGSWRWSRRGRRAEGADTLITAGGVQSNHARATAATAARLGMRAMLVVNGAPQPKPTANALLDRLLGAEVVYVATREERQPKMAEIADRLRAEGRRPFVIPIGASTPLGALGFALADGRTASIRCRRRTSSSIRLRRAEPRPDSSPVAASSVSRRV